MSFIGPGRNLRANPGCEKWAAADLLSNDHPCEGHSDGVHEDQQEATWTLDLIRELREGGYSHPIILATSIPEDSIPEQPGYDAYINKPYSERQLLAVVARIVGEHA